MKIYFCLIERDTGATPHMEILTSETDADAVAEARALLATHSTGTVAHIVCDDVPIGTVQRATNAH